MTENVFEQERSYGLVMHHVKRMLATGLITEAEFKKMNNHFKTKYHPIIGSTLVETQLQCTGNRVINGGGKEDFLYEEN